MGAPARATGLPPWVWSLGAGIIAAAAIASLWYLAIPRHEFCIAIYPGPAGCGAHRLVPATIWSVVLVAGAAAGAAAVHRIKRAWAGPGLLAVLAGVGLVAYRAVLYSGG